MNEETNFFEKSLLILWSEIEKITGQSANKGDATFVEFADWYRTLSFSPKQKCEIYKFWSIYTANCGFHLLKTVIEALYIETVINELSNRNPFTRHWSNPHVQPKKFFFCASSTYDYLCVMKKTNTAPQQDSFTLPNIEIDGNWKFSHIQDVSIEDESVELGKIVGLDLIVNDYENLPDFKLKTSTNCPDDCTNAHLSMMMLKNQTRDLRKLANSLYPVLKLILERKIVIDLVIYFLVCDLHRCASAVFWDCCPKGVVELFEKNRFIPLYIPFNQDGYWFDITATIKTNVPLQLVCWSQKTAKVLKEEFYEAIFQLNEELDYQQQTYSREKVVLNFPWKLARVAILIQSKQKIDRIRYCPMSNVPEFFDCQFTDEILLYKDKNYYWYSVSLLLTHDFREALFSNQLYNAYVMHLFFPFLSNAHKLTLDGKNLDLSNIKIYSRTINEDMAQYSMRIPRYFD